MKALSRTSYKIGATLVAAAVAFCGGFILAASYYERWAVPALVKKYPHDGQIGLEEFVDSLNIACTSAFVVLVIGIVWIIRTSKRSERV